MLAFTDLTCTRGGRTLFRRVGAQLHAGESLRVTGANGSGKTSLLRMVCGLLAPSAGTVQWRGRDIVGLREEYSRDLVYLGHAAALKDDLSPLENLQAACALAGRRVEAADARRALHAAGLHGCERVLVRRLSQGQRQRSALSRLMLAGRTPLWVLDEPFNALDQGACGWLSELLRTHVQRGGIVVLTSHLDLPLAGTPHRVLAL